MQNGISLARPPPRGGLAGLLRLGASMSSDRVMVFVDYENMYRCARSEFDLTAGHFWPHRLGQQLVQIRNSNQPDRPSYLADVRVYRGLPDARLQPDSNAANQAQTTAWTKACPIDVNLTVMRRPLKYPSEFPKRRPQEKGVDVALAVDLVQLTYQGAYDVAIVCSHDSDLAPALDVVTSVKTVHHHLEVASWAKYRRISLSSDAKLPWCHRLDQADFDAVADGTDYLPRSRS